MQQALQRDPRFEEGNCAGDAALSVSLRRHIEERGATPNIPPKANRKWKNCFSPFIFRNRTDIEPMFCRLKDFRLVATRYDRNAVNFFAADCIATTVSYWLWVSALGTLRRLYPR